MLSRSYKQMLRHIGFQAILTAICLVVDISYPLEILYNKPLKAQIFNSENKSYVISLKLR